MKKWHIVVALIVLAGIGIYLKDRSQVKDHTAMATMLKQSCERQQRDLGMVPAEKIESVCGCITNASLKEYGAAGMQRISEHPTEQEIDTLRGLVASCTSQSG